MIPKEIKKNIIRTMMMYGETFYGRHTPQYQLQKSKIKVKSKKQNKQTKIAFGNKNTQNYKNWRLGLIESVHVQHCCLRGCILPLARLKRF